MSEGPQSRKLTYSIRHFVNDMSVSMMLPLWRRGWNTYTIAKELGLPECEVANRLPMLREQRRLMQGGGQ